MSDEATKLKQLDEAILKWLGEANALSLETGTALTEIRRAFGPGILSAWNMGTFVGPCAHGSDPYTRCDDCELLEPREAFVKALMQPVLAERDAAIAAATFAAEELESLLKEIAERQREASARLLEGTHRREDGNCEDRARARGGTAMDVFGSACANCSRADMIRAGPLVTEKAGG